MTALSQPIPKSIITNTKLKAPGKSKSQKWKIITGCMSSVRPFVRTCNIGASIRAAIDQNMKCQMRPRSLLLAGKPTHIGIENVRIYRISINTQGIAYDAPAAAVLITAYVRLDLGHRRRSSAHVRKSKTAALSATFFHSFRGIAYDAIFLPFCVSASACARRRGEGGGGLSQGCSCCLSCLPPHQKTFPSHHCRR